MAKINKRSFYNKKTDKQEVRFYFGNKRATEEQKRSYIKSNFADIDRSQLSKEDNAYYGRVLGGKKRAEEAVRIDGKFIYLEFIKKNNFERLAHAKGYKNDKELLEKEPALYKRAKETYNSEFGLEYSYNSETIIPAIETFVGDIFLRAGEREGSEISKLRALEKIDHIDKQLKRKFGCFLVIYYVKYIKSSLLKVWIPTDYFIGQCDGDAEEFENNFQASHEVQLLFSEKIK